MAEENSESNERTEDPTPRRLEEALRRGDVVKSMEVNTWFTIAGGTLMIMVFAAPMASSLQTTFRGLLAKSYQIPTDGPALTALIKTLGFDVLAAFGVPLLLLCVAAFAGNIVAAPHRVHDRIGQAATVADFADGPASPACSRGRPWRTLPRGSPSCAWSAASWR